MNLSLFIHEYVFSCLSSLRSGDFCNKKGKNNMVKVRSLCAYRTQTPYTKKDKIATDKRNMMRWSARIKRWRRNVIRHACQPTKITNSNFMVLHTETVQERHHQSPSAHHSQVCRIHKVWQTKRKRNKQTILLRQYTMEIIIKKIIY